MSEVTLIFDDGEGDRTEVPCSRVQQLAADVRSGDYIACPYSGFIHVHTLRVEGSLVYFSDCHKLEHMYHVRTLLEIARPVKVTEGGVD